MADKPKVDIKDIIKQEYVKCATDPIYFIKNYVMIQEPKRGRIKFALFKYQEDAIVDFESEQFNIILKGRQIGISTAAAAYSLWMMLFHKDRNILVIATKQDTAKTMITKVRFAYEHLPVWLQVECLENNKLSLKFKNGSQIKASTAAGDSGRSEALSLLILDEAAFIENAEDIWTAALPTLSTGGNAILISTPNGVGNLFHKIWVKATEGSNPDDVKFNPIKLDWRVHPDRDQAWRDKMGAVQGEREARQEFDAEFLGSGNTVIDEYLILEYKEKIKHIVPLQKTGFDGNLYIYEHPSVSRQYIVVADVARGDAVDFSAFHVFDVESMTQVAEYKGKIGTTEYAVFLMSVAMQYNSALLVVERENIGWAVLQEVINRNYPNLFYMSKDRQVVETHRNLTNRYNREERQMVPGFSTSVKTRPLIISKIDTYMREKAVNINSLRLLTEFDTFIWNNGKAEAMDGYNDDLVMAFGIALWVRDTSLRLYQEGIQLTRSALDNIKKTSVDAIYLPNGLTQDPYKMPLGIGNNSNMSEEMEDIRWLLS